MKMLINDQFIKKSSRVPTIKFINLNNWPIKWSLSLLFGSFLKMDSTEDWSCLIMLKVKVSYFIALSVHSVYYKVLYWFKYVFIRWWYDLKVFLQWINLETFFLWTCRPSWQARLLSDSAYLMIDCMIDLYLYIRKPNYSFLKMYEYTGTIYLFIG